jgi:hypothetical protein
MQSSPIDRIKPRVIPLRITTMGEASGKMCESIATLSAGLDDVFAA